MSESRNQLPRMAMDLSTIFSEFTSELHSISDGWVELRIHKTNNALENPCITKQKRTNGKITADYPLN